MIGYRQTVEPGDILARPINHLPGLHHYGTAVGNGWVVDTMPVRGKGYTTLAEFADRQPVTVIRLNRPEFQSLVIAQAAAAVVGRKPYDVLTANCEHDVSRVHFGIEESPTVNLLKIGLLTGAAFLLLSGFGR
jgi:hypothetical protein